MILILFPLLKISQASTCVSMDKFFQTLMTLENETQKGRNKDTGLWAPHKSFEGGSDTIGYGHKLQENDDFSKGLTDDQVKGLFVNDVQSKIAEVKQYLKANSNNPNVPSWEALPDRHKKMLIETQYNTGDVFGKYPTMVKAMAKGDDKVVEDYYKRRFAKDETGKRKRLSRRMKMLVEALDASNEN